MIHFPLNIKIGDIEISSHLVFELLAYSIGYRYYIYLRNKTVDTISSENRTILFIAAALGAFIFSRIIGYMETPEFFKGEFSFIQLYSNKTILGGLMGGLIAVEICKKIIGVTQSSGDLLTFPLLLAMIIGRLGCFSAGLEDGTYGVASTLPWAINFGDGIYRHPTTLYEIIYLILTWLTIYSLEKKYILSNGAKFKIFLADYFIFRFFIEFIKPIYIFDIGLSAIQLTSLIGIIYYYQVFLKPQALIERKKYA